MEWTKEQIEEIVRGILNTSLATMRKFLEDKIEALDVPDTRNLATKKLVSDAIQELKTGFNDEIVKVQTAVTKIATETETKIKELTPPKTKPWYATLLDE